MDQGEEKGGRDNVCAWGGEKIGYFDTDSCLKSFQNAVGSPLFWARVNARQEEEELHFPRGPTAAVPPPVPYQELGGPAGSPTGTEPWG